MSPFPFIKVWVSMESTDISIYSFNLFLLHYDKAVQVLSGTLLVKTCLLTQWKCGHSNQYRGNVYTCLSKINKSD